ncbi:MAG: CxxxxCH/CxxCH domain-containing protein [Reyranella sp.]|uniref:CxxxxCH/CxxCH domain-containing protein n=1 Tax=Reyranella sp. TaxID=1929291 RepID=UPI0012210C75|nr:MAG: CxxxxCH/CxxCH domain-containing protein [Reyranella sp.]TBR29716.1 MAG: CxxxxCH/CxxCH domain-containing protein [Reyranella sp.]
MAGTCSTTRCHSISTGSASMPRASTSPAWCARSAEAYQGSAQLQLRSCLAES